MKKIPKFNKCRAFNKAAGPGKKPKLINVGPTFIPDYRVVSLKHKPISFLLTKNQYHNNVIFKFIHLQKCFLK